MNVVAERERERESALASVMEGVYPDVFVYTFVYLRFPFRMFFSTRFAFHAMLSTIEVRPQMKWV
ncbi:hypothetical protein AMELA_G00096620 [Ameiurus melas]|uniref:Uncharacterized protein n=1 Tax=Ameiurus melas TaxID=219545 RepID=A0A7J6AUD7_AMEME|nr:hypothetical protein AMELA_G00096620 [Ameiurus melas]